MAGYVTLRPAGTAISLRLWRTLGFRNFSECVKPRQRVLRINNTNVFSSHPIKSGVTTRNSDEIKPGVDILNRANADVGSAERQIVTQSRLYSRLKRGKKKLIQQFKVVVGFYTFCRSDTLRSQLLFFFFHI